MKQENRKPVTGKFLIAQFLLLLLACIFYGFNSLFIPVTLILAANFIYVIRYFPRRGLGGQIFSLINLFATGILCGQLLIDNLNIPRFIEKDHIAWFGIDAALICWVLFWISYLGNRVIRR